MSDHVVPIPVVNISQGKHGGIIEMHTCVPLKSKCLTANNLKQITHALGVPSSSSSDEIRTLVERKLVELGNEPHNTQAWCG